MADELTRLIQHSINLFQAGLAPPVAERSANINSAARSGPDAASCGLRHAGGRPGALLSARGVGCAAAGAAPLLPRRRWRGRGDLGGGGDSGGAVRCGMASGAAGLLAAVAALLCVVPEPGVGAAVLCCVAAARSGGCRGVGECCRGGGTGSGTAVRYPVTLV